MECPNCKEDVFPGQFRCHKCGKLVKTEDNKKKTTDKKSVGKEK